MYRLVGQMKNGIIVESIEDGKRFPVHGSAKVSALDEISIYTAGEEVPLKEVFRKIYEKQDGKQALSHKEDNDKVKAFFKQVLPDYDPDRVYVSDMIKVIKWYNLLIQFNAYDPNEVSEAAEDVAETETKNEEVKAAEAAEEKKKPAKKATAKKTDKPAAAKKAAAPKSVSKTATKAKTTTTKSAPKKAGGSSSKKG